MLCPTRTEELQSQGVRPRVWFGERWIDGVMEEGGVAIYSITSAGRIHRLHGGASTPLGAAAYAQAVDELFAQIEPPDVIVHSSSSGGTQAGIVAGCTLAGAKTHVIGISADESAAGLEREIRAILSGMGELLAVGADRFTDVPVHVDDRFVGEGYGVPTDASRKAIELVARTEAIFLDPTYTSKAMAALVRHVRTGEVTPEETVVFLHTGGMPALFTPAFAETYSIA